MARSLPAHTWARGFQEKALDDTPLWAKPETYQSDSGEQAHYHVSDPGESPTTTLENQFGRTSLRSWPSIYNGTSAERIPPWWKPSPRVDVLICGAGPFGLAMGVCLARHGVSFRIIDTNAGPCHSGRADSLQPRALELVQSWGLGEEFSEEGPIINKLIMRRNGETIVNNYTMQSDTRFRGNHVITQGQIEKVYVRDLVRHGMLVEREKQMVSFNVSESTEEPYPVTTTLSSLQSQQEEVIQARYLIGADGASSAIRQKIGIEFDGLSVDCFFAILDAPFKTDYPHILDFSISIKTEQGGIILVPREMGSTRVYVQLPRKYAERVVAVRGKQREAGLSDSGNGQVMDHGITVDEIMELFNAVLAPHKVEFAGPLSWFAVWRVNERVARSYFTPDRRVILGGDAAHVHSVLGAFGLNSSIYDAANLSWKLALCVRGRADGHKLLDTYDSERRIFANKVIRFSGGFLRFVCNLDMPLATLCGLGDAMETTDDTPPDPNMNNDEAKKWLGQFFGKMPRFMTGLQWPIVNSVLTTSPVDQASIKGTPLLSSGIRAPDCRVSLSADRAGYLYDALAGGTRFHVLIFTSDLRGPIVNNLSELSALGFGVGGWWDRFGRHSMFSVVLVVKSLPREVDALLADTRLTSLRLVSQVVYDDKAPDEDAHYCYQVNHAEGAVVLIRPDLTVAMSARPGDAASVDAYLSSFLKPVY